MSARQHTPRQVNVVSFTLAVLLCACAALLPLNYVRLEPGDTFDALGKYDGKNVVVVADSKKYPVYPPAGEIRLLTVNEWGGPYGRLSWFDAIRAVRNPNILIAPTEFFYSSSDTPDSTANEDQTAFAGSTSAAIAAALNYLRIPLTEKLYVQELAKGKPVEKALKVGDRLISLNGVRVATSRVLYETLLKIKPGDNATVVVSRHGKNIQRTFATYEGDDGMAWLGVHVYTDYSGPMSIKVQLEDVGGPSAGLAFTLAIVDQLTPGNLTGGDKIAVTGEIADDGWVSAIGGLPQKIAAAYRDGARTMLIPVDNCEDVPPQAPKDLRIVPVESLKTAMSALDALRKGAQATRC